MREKKNYRVVLNKALFDKIMKEVPKKSKVSPRRFVLPAATNAIICDCLVACALNLDSLRLQVITVYSLVENYKINGSVARAIIRELLKSRGIRPVALHARNQIYTRSQEQVEEVADEKAAKGKKQQKPAKGAEKAADESGDAKDAKKSEKPKKEEKPKKDEKAKKEAAPKKEGGDKAEKPKAEKKEKPKAAPKKE